MSVLKQFCEVLRGQEFLVLDTETTGLQSGEIVSIAIINNRGETLIDWLVRPFDRIPDQATAIHGITNEMVYTADSWAVIAPAVKGLIKGQNVVIYNAVYDRRMMHQSDRLWNLPDFDYKAVSNFYCAMEAFAEFYGDYNAYRGSYTWQKLSVAMDEIGAEWKGKSHSALSDCLATLDVTNFLLSQMHDFDAEAYGNKDISEDLGL